jgi:hypothetical protein
VTILGTIVALGRRMGVVLLLVSLPAFAVLALVLRLFDGIPAIVLSTMILGAIGSLVQAAREWDAPDVDHARTKRATSKRTSVAP